MICDLDEELCKTRGKEFGFSNYTLRYEEILVNFEIDVIGIYTPDHLHAKHIMMALEAGKHGNLEMIETHYIGDHR